MTSISHRRLRAVVTFFLFFLSGAPLAGAQTEPAGPEPSGSQPLRVEEIIIRAHPLSAEGLAQAAIVLTGEELDREMQPSIGATVGYQPGINSLSFGQAAGRPIIHGLGGPRVRVMEDRIDTMDASVTSGDHATAIEAYIADGIEILKGPSTLLYGSGAIGGIVDVHTGRIPHAVPDAPFIGRAEARGGDNAAMRSGAVRVDGGAGSFAWHLDGFSREAGEYRIPGFAESERQRAAEAAEGGEGEDGEDEVQGVVEGSQFESQGGAFGVSFIGERGLIGVAISNIDAEYGLPGGHEHEHGEGEDDGAEEGNPILDMRQTRVDLELALSDPLAGFSSLNVRAGFNDYRHDEIEPEGDIGTRFSNDAYETRAELVHNAIAEWEGVLGLQVAGREFAVSGEEAFVPPVDTSSAGVFWLGERNVGATNSIEAGVRLERVKHEPAAGGSQSFDAFGASIGYVIAPDALWTFGLLADFSQRAPVSEELYSFGPHLATRSFDIGDSSLNEERALNLSATFNYRSDDLELYATVYRTQFQDFIYQLATGEIRDDLTVLEYRQDDATFFGFDMQIDATIYNFGFDRRLRASAMFDTVDAELDVSGNDRLPLIPPTRYGVGLSLDWDRVRASLDYLRFAEQDEVAANELPTDAYNDLRAYLGASVPIARGALDVFLQGRNLTDDEQRSHTSLIKDFAPLPGRTVEVGVRLSF